MNRNDIELLYAYNRWANAKVLKAVSALTKEQFTRDLGGSYRSVRDTLVHIMSAEWIWLMRWKGTSSQAMHNPAEFPRMDVVRTKWSQIEREQAEFVKGVTDRSLTEVISYVNTQGETWQYTLAHMMQHLVNHSSYHRGQVSLMLRQLGAEPVPTDFLVFFDMGGKVD
jgi:uncharacterized damage-inducible protein DinB